MDGGFLSNSSEMTSAVLVRLPDVKDRDAAIRDMTEIFFESSSRTFFVDETERAAFRERWLGYYLETHGADIWLCQERDGRIAGYLTGCRQSAEARQLFQAISSYAVFADCFHGFPAHLHVNCREDRRGLGVGKRLVDTFVGQCRGEGLSGLHIVTAPDSRNVRFYARCGFNHRVVRTWCERSLLFMGCDLTQETLP